MSNSDRDCMSFPTITTQTRVSGAVGRATIVMMRTNLWGMKFNFLCIVSSHTRYAMDQCNDRIGGMKLTLNFAFPTGALTIIHSFLVVGNSI